MFQWTGALDRHLGRYLDEADIRYTRPLAFTALYKSRKERCGLLELVSNRSSNRGVVGRCRSSPALDPSLADSVGRYLGSEIHNTSPKVPN